MKLFVRPQFRLLNNPIQNKQTPHQYPPKNKKQPLYTLNLLLQTSSSLSLQQKPKPKQKRELRGNKPRRGSDAQSNSSHFLNFELGEYKDYSKLFNTLNLNETLEESKEEYEFEHEYDLSSFINNHHDILSTSIDKTNQSGIIISERDTSEMKETDHINIVYKSIDAKFI